MTLKSRLEEQKLDRRFKLPSWTEGGAGNEEINASLLHLMQESNTIFLSVCLREQSLSDFVQTFVSYRSCAITIGPKASQNSQAVPLDKLVSAVFVRFSTCFEQGLDNASSSSGKKAGVDSIPAFQSEFRDLFKDSPFLSTAVVLDFVAALGESNGLLASTTLKRLVSIRPQILTEYADVVDRNCKEIQRTLSKFSLASEDARSLASALHKHALVLQAFSAEQAAAARVVESGGMLSHSCGKQLWTLARCVYDSMDGALLQSNAAVSLSAAMIVLRLLQLSTATASLRTTVEGWSWFDAVSSPAILDLLSAQSSSAGAVESARPQRSLIADCLSRVPQVKALLSPLLLTTLGDPEFVDQFLQSVSASSAVAPASAAAAAATTEPSSSTTAPSLSMQQKIQGIKDMFPDLGAGFIEACLHVYQGKEDDVIDAILQDNLHPKLGALDRAAEAIWFGKNRNDQALLQPITRITPAAGGSTAGKSSARDTVDILAYRQNTALVEDQKTYLRQLDQRRLQDAQILRKEYDDDYDDQFDDVAQVSVSVTEGDEVTVNNLGVVTGGKGKGAATAVQSSKAGGKRGGGWSQEMDDIRRYNALLRQEEAEVSFWQGMRNTNHDAGRGVRPQRTAWKDAGDDEEGDGQAAGASAAASTADKATGRPMQQQQQQQQQRGVPAGGGKPSSTEGRGRGDANNANANNNPRSNDAPRGGASSSSGGAAKQAPGNRPSEGKGKGPATGEAARPRSEGGREAGAGAGEKPDSDAHKKHRHKTFDKHHQKDKSLKKLGAFRPT